MSNEKRPPHYFAIAEKKGVGWVIVGDSWEKGYLELWGRRPQWEYSCWQVVSRSELRQYGITDDEVLAYDVNPNYVRSTQYEQ